MMERQLVPKDRQRIIKMLEPEYILEQLRQEDPIRFLFHNGRGRRNPDKRS